MKQKWEFLPQVPSCTLSLWRHSSYVTTLSVLLHSNYVEKDAYLFLGEETRFKSVKAQVMIRKEAVRNEVKRKRRG